MYFQIQKLEEENNEKLQFIQKQVIKNVEDNNKIITNFKLQIDKQAEYTKQMNMKLQEGMKAQILNLREQNKIQKDTAKKIQQENKKLEEKIKLLEVENKNLVNTIEVQIDKLLDKKLKALEKKQQLENQKAKSLEQAKKQPVVTKTIKTETKQTSRKIEQIPAQAAQIPRQTPNGSTRMVKQAVKIEPIQIKEAASTITPKIRPGKTQILGFFDNNPEDLY